MPTLSLVCMLHPQTKKLAGATELVDVFMIRLLILNAEARTDEETSRQDIFVRITDGLYNISCIHLFPIVYVQLSPRTNCSSPWLCLLADSPIITITNAHPEKHAGKTTRDQLHSISEIAGSPRHHYPHTHPKVFSCLVYDCLLLGFLNNGWDVWDEGSWESTISDWLSSSSGWDKTPTSDCCDWCWSDRGSASWSTAERSLLRCIGP